MCDEADAASLPSAWTPGQVACLGGVGGNRGGREDSGSQERMNSTMQTRAKQPLPGLPQEQGGHGAAPTKGPLPI